MGWNMHSMHLNEKGCSIPGMILRGSEVIALDVVRNMLGQAPGMRPATYLLALMHGDAHLGRYNGSCATKLRRGSNRGGQIVSESS